MKQTLHLSSRLGVSVRSTQSHRFQFGAGFAPGDHCSGEMAISARTIKLAALRRFCNEKCPKAFNG
ncbi:hypothetical protein Fuma_05548 [Fuerstiella marisgermanici]|uniref:Uncharacterized protein n=1 Tax=Fuerstiella marisgermanici TaxID=1891926 RepID=A0A1P8WPC2_9PLAN|nr:hypothetical protein Fuma_05548 [Fuerstiella marisgermanici]